MFYLWPIDRCSNSRTALCWQSLDKITCYLWVQLLDCLVGFLPGSHVIPTLKLIGVGGLLPRMIFHRLEPMFEYPEKWDFPIYIYTVSLFLGFFDVFWRFLTFFGFYRFFVHYTHVFWRFLPGRFHLFEWDIFNFCPIWEMGSIFAFFGLFFYGSFFWTVLVECGISRATSIFL